jgi:hypothetical protein
VSKRDSDIFDRERRGDEGPKEGVTTFIATSDDNLIVIRGES